MNFKKRIIEDFEPIPSKRQAICVFRDVYYFLSNFYMCSVMYDEVLYPSSEHAYQAVKTLDKSQREIIRRLNRPSDAKSFARFLQLREDWDKVKINIMYQIIKDKFTRNKNLATMLIQTKDAVLEEGNTWGGKQVSFEIDLIIQDRFWGKVDGKGSNHLGKILMKVREELVSKNKNTIN